MILRTLRGRIISFSALILAILTVATFYSSQVIMDLNGSLDYLFKNNIAMEEIHSAILASDASLTDYLRTKSSDSLRTHIQYSTRLGELGRTLNRRIVNHEALLLQRTLAGLLDHYLLQAEACIKAKRGRDIQGYTQAYDRTQSDSGGIRHLLTLIQRIYLTGSLDSFGGYKSRIPLVVTTNTVLILSAFLMGFLLLVRYSYSLTDPLLQLAQAARAMGRGDYETRYPIPSSTDEVRTTAQAFLTMQESIHRAFEDLKSKTALEKRLLEEEMKGLLMSHQLKEAELLALQTQINPHFLYNTLSAGFQLALVENADRTADFLEDLGAFIRYVLRNPSRQVPIREEMECLRRYVNLMKLRFGDRYGFRVHGEEELMNRLVPALILQPLVENAINHGLKDREEGGLVEVSVQLRDGGICLSVKDNGTGMEPGVMRRVLEDSESPGVSGSIGLRNVIRRIAIATEGRGRVVLLGESGLEVQVWIPREEGQP